MGDHEFVHEGSGGISSVLISQAGVGDVGGRSYFFKMRDNFVILIFQCFGVIFVLLHTCDSFLQHKPSS